MLQSPRLSHQTPVSAPRPHGSEAWPSPAPSKCSVSTCWPRGHTRPHLLTLLVKAGEWPGRHTSFCNNTLACGLRDRSVCQGKQPIILAGSRREGRPQGLEARLSRGPGAGEGLFWELLDSKHKTMQTSCLGLWHQFVFLSPPKNVPIFVFTQ